MMVTGPWTGGKIYAEIRKDYTPLEVQRLLHRVAEDLASGFERRQSPH
jgi:hypothetical protein